MVKTAIRYAQISGLSFAVNLGLTMFLHEICRAPEELAFAVALLVVFLMNFFAMRHYIYDGRGGRAARQFTIYTGSAVGFRASEYLAFLMVHSWLGFDYRWAVVAITVGMACAKFFYYRIVFERRAETCC
jgi:putative flippase GtrA